MSIAKEARSWVDKNVYWLKGDVGLRFDKGNYEGTELVVRGWLVTAFRAGALWERRRSK